MQQGNTAAARTALEGALARFPIVLPFVLYCAFAAACYAIQGPEPSLSIDHISYFKLADEIRDEFPRGDYWRSFNSVRAYGVILAYAYDLTGSHLVSLKLLLAAMTVAYLGAFQVFMGLATPSRSRAVLFSLLSALFVSFGASIWGMTDFSASLNRTIILPFVVLLVWFFFRAFASPWRYAVFPALILLSQLHLSALHVFLVFGANELLDFVFRRRLRLDRNLAWFAIALACSGATQVALDTSSASTSGFVSYTLNMSVPTAEEVIASPGRIATAPGMKPAPRPAPGKPADKLSNDEAWKIEILAFPWRNFPPTLATIATMASSFGVILLLAVAGAARAFRPGVARPLDRGMLAFAFAVLLAAYGLQVLLWMLRKVIPVFPINFEEIRAINMIMMPSVYFTFRLYELAPESGRWPARATRIAIVLAFALQPILLVRALPAPWREGLIEQAVTRGVLKSSDAPRMLYARQFLGLADEGRRFYYSSRPVIAWLERNTGPNDKVLTNLNEIHMSRVKSVGPFLGIVSLDVWDLRRGTWAESLESIDQALAARDAARVLALARSLGATYAIVDWPVEDTAYRDEYFSVLRVQP